MYYWLRAGFAAQQYDMLAWRHIPVTDARNNVMAATNLAILFIFNNHSYGANNVTKQPVTVHGVYSSSASNVL